MVPSFIKLNTVNAKILIKDQNYLLFSGRLWVENYGIQNMENFSSNL
jgi:hypothetical protein